jgi:predicted phosphodiesterase
MKNPCKQSLHVLALLILIFSLLAASCVPAEAFLRGDQSAWKFAVISDTQGNNRDAVNKSCINDAVVRAIADDIAKEKPDLVLVAGDLVNGWFRNGGTDYDTQYTNWKKAMAPVYHAGISVYPVRGNHDSGPERLALPPLPAHLEPPPDTVIRLKEAFRKNFAEIPKNGPDGEEGLTYSFAHKNAFFIGLDQYVGGQHKIHQGWFERQLAGNRQPHVFVYGHEPAFGARHRDNLGFYPSDRDAFWNALGRAGGRIYFCGHDHFYNRALIDDAAGHPIRQIIVGTGGGSLKQWSGLYQDGKSVRGECHESGRNGYALVTVEEAKITVVWKAIMQLEAMDGRQYLDAFTYSINPAPRMGSASLSGLEPISATSNRRTGP